MTTPVTRDNVASGEFFIFDIDIVMNTQDFESLPENGWEVKYINGKFTQSITSCESIPLEEQPVSPEGSSLLYSQIYLTLKP